MIKNKEIFQTLEVKPTVLVYYKCSNPECFNLINLQKLRNEIPDTIICPVCFGTAYRINYNINNY